MIATPLQQRQALWIAFALILVWGANFTVQKIIFPVLTPPGFLFVRFLLMPVCAAAFMCYRYGIDWPPVDRRDVWLLARLALAGHVLHVGLVTYGIHWSTAFSSSLILACGPLFTLLLLRVSGTEKLAIAQIAGVLLACAGVVVFLSDKLFGARWEASSGDLVLVAAALCFSYYTVAAKPAIERLGGVPVMAYTTFIASPLLVAISWEAGSAIDWSTIGWPIWAGVGWAVLVSAFAGWIVWGYVNTVRGVARTAPLMYLMPVVAGAVSWMIVAEPMTVEKIVGALITLAGVALAQYGAVLGRRWTSS